MLIWPATRFVAGESREEALAVARELNEEGVLVSLDLLGENVTDRDRAAGFRDAYVELVGGIGAAGVDANISIKLSMLGLDIEQALARDHVITILQAAAEHDTWVRIDMEGSPYTQMTLEVFHEVFEEHPNVGVVIQSMLRRSRDDVERLIDVGARVRLVKGAYKEPAPLAFQEKERVNEEFDRLAERLLDDGVSPAIATHDQDRIDHALRYVTDRGIPADRFEFQFLYGMRRKTRRSLVERGYRMRVYVPFGEEWLPYFTRRLRERRENVLFVLKTLTRR
ncbi:MAG: proline dehydrogenase family protein [Gemmatimonadota bacterium]|nr:proline dehydrogenase family protein [Gemmatimonadota bacterium]